MTKYVCPNCNEVGENTTCACGNTKLVEVGSVKVYANNALTTLTYKGYNAAEEYLGISYEAKAQDTQDRRYALMQTINDMQNRDYTAALPTEWEYESDGTNDPNNPTD
jgi:hypothetical protein